MRLLVLSALLLGLSCANAATYTHSFTGTVTAINATGGFPTGPLVLGDVISGSFTVDTSAAIPFDTSNGLWFFAVTQASVTLQTAGLSWSSSANSGAAGAGQFALSDNSPGSGTIFDALNYGLPGSNENFSAVGGYVPDGAVSFRVENRQSAGGNPLLVDGGVIPVTPGPFTAGQFSMQFSSVNSPTGDSEVVALVFEPLVVPVPAAAWLLSPAVLALSALRRRHTS